MRIRWSKSIIDCGFKICERLIAQQNNNKTTQVTGALRAFGDVSQDFGDETLSGKRKRKRIGGKEQDWSTLTQQLLDRCSKADANEVNCSMSCSIDTYKSQEVFEGYTRYLMPVSS